MFILYAVTLLSLSVPKAEAATSNLQSGLYGESLRVAVNEQQGTLTGYYSSAGGYLSGEGWNCNFYFSGKLNDKPEIDIVASSIHLKKDEVRTEAKGTISKAEAGLDAVVLKLSSDISGCVRGEDFLEDTPSIRKINSRNDSFEPAEIRDRSRSFEFRVVKAKKSYFYGSAAGRNQKRSYLVCGDVVVVREKNDATQRVKAVFTGAKKASEVWINLHDLLEVGGSLKCPGDR